MRTIMLLSLAAVAFFSGCAQAPNFREPLAYRAGGQLDGWKVNRRDDGNVVLKWGSDAREKAVSGAGTP